MGGLLFASLLVENLPFFLGFLRSRIRNSGQLLLAQPYSPMLFRQGVQPGPHLLLQVLSGELTPAEAQKEWKIFNKKTGDQKTKSASWLQKLQIPCRRCTDSNNGVEVLRPLSAFTPEAKEHVGKIWQTVLAKGQDACCRRCVHHMGSEPESTNIFCETCCSLRPKEFFDEEAQKIWSMKSDEAVD